MTRQEFDTTFKPMCKALNVGINQQQATIFWDEFKAHDYRDLAHACRELSMGNPGYLPKLVFFRDNILAAKEMRLDREKARATKVHEFGSGGMGNDYDLRFGKLCSLNITEIIVKQSDLGARKAKLEIMQALNDPDFDGHTFNWVAPNGMRPQVWLRTEVEKRMPSVVA